MELLVIILVLVYSVWSEVNKKKQEENVDIDFSELASLDDFFKDSPSSPSQKTAGKPPAAKKQPKPRSQRIADAAPNRGDYAVLTGRVNYERGDEKPLTNYDELPQLSGVVNYERQARDESAPGDQLSEEARKMFELGRQEQPAKSPVAPPPKINFDRESIIKAFVMSEVLQRYDLERIYSRIPGINQQQED